MVYDGFGGPNKCRLITVNSRPCCPPLCQLHRRDEHRALAPHFDSNSTLPHRANNLHRDSTPCAATKKVRAAPLWLGHQ